MNNFYGASLQTSPKPFQVVGYQYLGSPSPISGNTGKRRELYRVEVSKVAYNRAVRAIKGRGGSLVQKDRALFLWFKPLELTIPVSEVS